MYGNTRPARQIRIGGPLTPVVLYLIIANVGFFILQQFTEALFGTDVLVSFFGLVPELVTREGQVWRLASYLVLHGDTFHLLFNMLALWMFGGDVERAMGSRRFLAFYFITGVAAGVLNYAFSALLYTSAMRYTVTIGASGSIYGILVAFGTLFPNRTVLAFFIFPMRARLFMLLFAGLEFLATFSYAPTGVARLAHLGGMLAGFVYFLARGHYNWPSWFGLRTAVTRPRVKLDVIYGGRVETEEPEAEPPPEAPQARAGFSASSPFTDDEVEEIARKISRGGVGSLTPKEKAIWENVKSRMH